MSVLENLPVDTHAITDQEEQILTVLFNDEKVSNTPHTPHPPHPNHPYLVMFEEALIIIVLFLVFSFPQIEEYLGRIHVRGTTSVLLVKIVLILILYGLIKRIYV